MSEFTYGGERGELAARLRRLDECNHWVRIAVTPDWAQQGRACEIVTETTSSSRLAHSRRRCLTHGESWTLPRTYLQAGDALDERHYVERVERYAEDYRRDRATLRRTGVDEHSAALAAIGGLEAILTPGSVYDHMSPAQRLAKAAAVLDALYVATHPAPEEVTDR